MCAKDCYISVFSDFDRPGSVFYSENFGRINSYHFASIFFRNAVNVGLPILECKGAAEVASGAEGELDLAAGRFRAGGLELAGAPCPQAMRRLIDAGGLMPYVAAKLAASGKQD